MTTESRMREALEERVAQITAHRACGGEEHDPANGKLHGCCVVCLVPWPCAYAGTPPALSPPARRTSYEWVADGVSFRIYWFSKGRGDGLWAVERKAGDRWSPDFGLTTYAAAAIATLAGLTKPEDES